MKNKLTETVEIKEGELFCLLWLLDYQGYVYYDEDNDLDIVNLEKHLIKNNINFTKGQINRKHISIL